LAPISVFTANFIESIDKKWISELFLWFVLMLPFALFFL
jgi:hypothetical protein